MFAILAAGVGVSHFMLGWASNTIAFVRAEFHTLIPYFKLYGRIYMLIKSEHHDYLPPRILSKYSNETDFVLR